MAEERNEAEEIAEKAEGTAEAEAPEKDEADAGEAEEEAGGEVLDRYGQPGINRDKYARDMKARDDRIAELEARVAEASKTEEAARELKGQIEELRASQADERVSYRLELSGCRNQKAAKALLPDYGGDVDKLRADCPYLFEDRGRKGSTGLRPSGAPRKTKAEINAIRDPARRRQAIAENRDLFGF